MDALDDLEADLVQQQRFRRSVRLSPESGTAANPAFWIVERASLAATYSKRSAAIGSNLEACHAGKADAIADAKPRSSATAERITGSREFPFAHSARTGFTASVSPKPIATPVVTLRRVEANTIRRTWPRCAPSAIRTPNSLVLCVTV